MAAMGETRVFHSVLNQPGVLSKVLNRQVVATANLLGSLNLSKI
jgi:hypothetical protein